MVDQGHVYQEENLRESGGKQFDVDLTTCVTL